LLELTLSSKEDLVHQPGWPLASPCDIYFLVNGRECYQHTHTHKKEEVPTKLKTFTAVR